MTRGRVMESRALLLGLLLLTYAVTYGGSAVTYSCPAYTPPATSTPQIDSTTVVKVQNLYDTAFAITYLEPSVFCPALGCSVRQMCSPDRQKCVCAPSYPSLDNGTTCLSVYSSGVTFFSASDSLIRLDVQRRGWPYDAVNCVYYATSASSSAPFVTTFICLLRNGQVRASSPVAVTRSSSTMMLFTPSAIGRVPSVDFGDAVASGRRIGCWWPRLGQNCEYTSSLSALPISSSRTSPLPQYTVLGCRYSPSRQQQFTYLDPRRYCPHLGCSANEMCSPDLTRCVCQPQYATDGACVYTWGDKSSHGVLSAPINFVGGQGSSSGCLVYIISVYGDLTLGTDGLSASIATLYYGTTMCPRGSGNAYYMYDALPTSSRTQPPSVDLSRQTTLYACAYPHYGNLCDEVLPVADRYIADDSAFYTGYGFGGSTVSSAPVFGMLDVQYSVLAPNDACPSNSCPAQRLCSNDLQSCIYPLNGVLFTFPTICADGPGYCGSSSAAIAMFWTDGVTNIGDVGTITNGLTPRVPYVHTMAITDSTSIILLLQREDIPDLNVCYLHSIQDWMQRNLFRTVVCIQSQKFIIRFDTIEYGGDYAMGPPLEDWPRPVYPYKGYNGVLPAYHTEGCIYPYYGGFCDMVSTPSQISNGAPDSNCGSIDLRIVSSSAPARSSSAAPYTGPPSSSVRFSSSVQPSSSVPPPVAQSVEMFGTQGFYAYSSLYTPSWCSYLSCAAQRLCSNDLQSCIYPLNGVLFTFPTICADGPGYCGGAGAPESETLWTDGVAYIGFSNAIMTAGNGVRLPYIDTIMVTEASDITLLIQRDDIGPFDVCFLHSIRDYMERNLYRTLMCIQSQKFIVRFNTVEYGDQYALGPPLENQPMPLFPYKGYNGVLPDFRTEACVYPYHGAFCESS